MPIYDYKCSNCGIELQIEHGMTEPRRKKCPNCKKDSLVRIIRGTNVIFKGEGFYVTDYAKKRSKKTSGADKKSTSNSGPS